MRSLAARGIWGVLVGLALLSQTCARAQPFNTDSVLAIWADPKAPDTARCNAANLALQSRMHVEFPDSALALARLVFAHAERHSLLEAMAHARLNEGRALAMLTRYDSALAVMEDARAHFERLDHDIGQANALVHWGRTHATQGHFAEARGAYERALVLAERAGSPKVAGLACLNLGIIARAQGDFRAAGQWQQRALKEGTAVNDRYTMAQAYNNLANVCSDTGNSVLALGFLEQSMRLKEAMGDKAGTISVLNNSAVIYKEAGDLGRAMDLYMRAMAAADELGMTDHKAMLYANMANVYDLQGDHRRAIEHHRAAYRIDSIAGDVEHMVMGLINQAGIHLLIDQLDTCIALYDRAWNMSRDLGSERYDATIRNGQSIALRKKGRLAEAIGMQQQALAYALKSGDRQEEGTAHTNLCFSLTDAQRYPEAIQHGTQALAIMRELGDKASISEAASALGAAYKRSGDFRQALDMHELAAAMDDSLHSEEVARDVARAEFRYSYGKKALADSLAHAEEREELEEQRTIESLRADRNRNRACSLAAVGLLVLAGGAALFASDRKRRQARFAKDAAVLETQALRSQMNPHFIFNALNSINAYVQANEADLASDYLARFARLMRMVLENSQQPEVPLRDDLEALRCYLELERMRGQERFDFSIEVDPSVDLDNTLVPPLVVQPFVENAIWHGLAGKKEKGRITLSVSRGTGAGSGNLILAVQDNGVGRQATSNAPPAPGRKTSLATAITRARLDLVERQKGRPAGLSYTDLAVGTRVEITLPMDDAA